MADRAATAKPVNAATPRKAAGSPMLARKTPAAAKAAGMPVVMIAAQLVPGHQVIVQLEIAARQPNVLLKQENLGKHAVPKSAVNAIMPPRAAGQSNPMSVNFAIK